MENRLICPRSFFLNGLCNHFFLLKLWLPPAYSSSSSSNPTMSEYWSCLDNRKLYTLPGKAMPLLLHLQQGTPTLSELPWWTWKVRLFGVQSQNHPGSCSHADLRKGARGPYTPSTYLDRGPLTRGWLTLTLGQAQNPGSCMLVDQKTNPRSRKLHACDHQGRPSTRKTENTLAPAQVIVRGQQHIGTQCKYSRENP